MLSPKLVRRLHRWIGLVFSVFVLLAAGSGALHTVMSISQSSPPPAPPNRLGEVAASAKLLPGEAATKLSPGAATALRSVRLVELDGRPLYRFTLAGETAPRYVFADTGEPDATADERLAARIASARLGGGAVKSTAFLTAYDNEYIAIFRILPVWRFDAGDEKHTRFYVSTDTGSVTRETDDGKQLEANIFGLAHKYMFIHAKGPRDFAMLAVMSGIALVALTGIALFFVTRPRKKSRNNADAE